MIATSTLLTLSTVYNCRSDTHILGFEDDILLSTTYFTSKPWTFSVVYGYDPHSSDELVNTMKRFKKSAFHPLMMPMVFAEHERSRFMSAMELKGPKAKERIYELKDRSYNNDDPREVRLAQNDWRSTESWVDVSDLKIGMVSFKRTMLVLREQFEKVGHLKPRLHVENTSENISESMSSNIIKGRLEKMDAELDTKIKECEGILNGMALAIQVVSRLRTIGYAQVANMVQESNHYTKRDVDTNIIIARLSHQEGNQMKVMSLVGMIFLPGTFLAVRQSAAWKVPTYTNELSDTLLHVFLPLATR